MPEVFQFLRLCVGVTVPAVSPTPIPIAPSLAGKLSPLRGGSLFDPHEFP